MLFFMMLVMMNLSPDVRWRDFLPTDKTSDIYLHTSTMPVALSTCFSHILFYNS